MTEERDKKRPREEVVERGPHTRGCATPPAYAMITVDCKGSHFYIVGIKFPSDRLARDVTSQKSYKDEFRAYVKTLAPPGYEQYDVGGFKPRISADPVPGISEWHSWTPPDRVRWIPARTKERMYIGNGMWKYRHAFFWIRVQNDIEMTSAKFMPSELIPLLETLQDPGSRFHIDSVRISYSNVPGILSEPPQDDWPIVYWADQVILPPDEDVKEDDEDESSD